MLRIKLAHRQKTGQTTLRRIRRSLSTARDRKAPADVLTEMLRHVPTGTLAGLRDRAAPPPHRGPADLARRRRDRSPRR
jgi:hypothetical protein